MESQHFRCRVPSCLSWLWNHEKFCLFNRSAREIADNTDHSGSSCAQVNLPGADKRNPLEPWDPYWLHFCETFGHWQKRKSPKKKPWISHYNTTESVKVVRISFQLWECVKKYFSSISVWSLFYRIIGTNLRCSYQGNGENQCIHWKQNKAPCRAFLQVFPLCLPMFQKGNCDSFLQPTAMICAKEYCLDIAESIRRFWTKLLSWKLYK